MSRRCPARRLGSVGRAPPPPLRRNYMQHDQEWRRLLFYCGLMLAVMLVITSLDFYLAEGQPMPINLRETQ